VRAICPARVSGRRVWVLANDRCRAPEQRSNIVLRVLLGNIREGLGTLRNPPFSLATSGNALLPPRGALRMRERPNFSGFVRWRPEAESNRCTRICSQVQP
jgi:hypothetical protein